MQKGRNEKEGKGRERKEGKRKEKEWQILKYYIDIKIQDTKGSEKKMDKRRVCIEDGKEKMQC